MNYKLINASLHVYGLNLDKQSHLKTDTLIAAQISEWRHHSDKTITQS